MAKDLGNDIDLTLGTGPEALGGAAVTQRPAEGEP
jgi:hypothetical protein